MVHTKIGGKFVIRFVSSGSRSTFDDIKYAWKIIISSVDQLMGKPDGVSVKRKSSGNRGTRKCSRNHAKEDQEEPISPQLLVDTDD